jgi:hypothetical protein
MGRPAGRDSGVQLRNREWFCLEGMDGRGGTGGMGNEGTGLRDIHMYWERN